MVLIYLLWVLLDYPPHLVHQVVLQTYQVVHLPYHLHHLHSLDLLQGQQQQLQE
jgi:hypothetical protein